jgi:hypothetical protein
MAMVSEQCLHIFHHIFVNGAVGFSIEVYIFLKPCAVFVDGATELNIQTGEYEKAKLGRRRTAVHTRAIVGKGIFSWKLVGLWRPKDELPPKKNARIQDQIAGWVKYVILPCRKVSERELE